MTDDPDETLAEQLSERFGAKRAYADSTGPLEAWQLIAGRGSCRHFTGEKVDADLLQTLCALALCAPSKSDLQQRDIVLVQDPDVRSAINALLTAGPLAQAWIADAPHLLVFCGNNRRQRQIHEWRGRPFVNDHLDAFFNAAVDAGIAMTTFIHAAEAAGLGCCPISAIRNHAGRVSELLRLPDHVFPVAGLGLGWPKFPPRITMRLPLDATVHVDKFTDDDVREHIEGYDRARNAHRPITAQRDIDRYGEDPAYGWSEDKARQYAKPERETFGDFVRNKGFKLD